MESTGCVGCHKVFNKNGTKLKAEFCFGSVYS